MNNWETITTEKRKAMEARIEQLEQSLQKAYEELETLKENDDEN